MIKRIESKGKYIALSVFAVFLLLGVFTYRDYGISTDETRQRSYSLINLKYIFSVKLATRELPDEIKYLQDITEYTQPEYGAALQLPMAMVEFLSQFQLEHAKIFHLRHLYIFLNFFLAAICFFFLIKQRFGSYSYAIIALIIFFLSPRLYADAFYNVKDSLFFSWFMISLFFFWRVSQKPSLLNCFLLGIAISLCANTRVAGFAILPFALLQLLYLTWKNKEEQIRYFVYLSLLFAVTMLTSILVSPTSWVNPIKHFIDCFLTFSRFPDWNGKVFYLGEYISGFSLPWHYLPVWIAITTPVLYILLFFAGIFFVFQMKRNEASAVFWFDLSNLLILVIFMAAVIGFHSTLYDGWRQMYFLYAPFLVLIVSGFVGLCQMKQSAVRWVLYAATLLSFVNTGSWMVQNHPYEHMYFNNLVRARAGDLFDRDYWGLSSWECLRYILDTDERNDVTIAYDRTNRNALELLKKEERARISEVGTIRDIAGNPAQDIDQPDYIISVFSDKGDAEQIHSDYEIVHTVHVDSTDIAVVYKYIEPEKLPATL